MRWRFVLLGHEITFYFTPCLRGHRYGSHSRKAADYLGTQKAWSSLKQKQNLSAVANGSDELLVGITLR